jgi:lysophospholipase L1-like esterase
MVVLFTAAAADRAAAQAGSGPAVVELRAGDRIAFVGDSFFERDSPWGLIETALTVAHPEKGLTFRNLGWSGDTVRGESRAYFGKAEDGYGELLKSVDLVKPTVIFLSYGANESFEGREGLDSFLTGYRKLLDDLASRTRRLVLLTPLPVDRTTSPVPAAAIEARNRVLAGYAEAIRTLAASRQLASVDVYTAMLGAVQTTPSHPGPLFEHGMHLTDAGYGAAASHIASRTGSTAIDIHPRDARLAPLRALIVRKNESFFHRWRPANMTYLYLFRQREQGNNAAEVPRFDPLIGGKEAEIAALLKTLAGDLR